MEPEKESFKKDRSLERVPFQIPCLFGRVVLGMALAQDHPHSLATPFLRTKRSFACARSGKSFSNSKPTAPENLFVRTSSRKSIKLRLVFPPWVSVLLSTCPLACLVDLKQAKVCFNHHSTGLMYIYMYIYIYACVYIYMYIYIYICIHVRVSCKRRALGVSTEGTSLRFP